MGPAMSALSNKRRKFAMLMATGEVSGAEAARRAGYSEKTARSQAQRLLTKVDIKQAIDEVQQAAVDDTIMSRHRALQVVSEIALSGKEHGNVRIKAVDTLSKMEGWNAPDKLEIKAEIDATLTPDEAYKELCGE